MVSYKGKQFLQVIGIGLCSTSMVYASAFQLQEQSAGLLGQSFAGSAAEASDASTTFYNPAGLSELSGGHVTISGVAITPNSTFTSSGGLPTVYQFPFLSPMPSDSTKPHGKAIVPGAYYAQQLNPDWVVGIGLTAPFGLITRYGNESVMRYMATRSEVRTYDYVPSIAYRLNENTSIGLGLDIMKVEAWLDLMTGANSPLPNVNDGYQKNYAKKWTVGGRIGMLTKLDDLKIGVSYRSGFVANAKGRSYQQAFSAPDYFIPVTSPVILPVQAKVKLPDLLVLSLNQKLDEKWSMMGDIQWTHWSRFKELHLYYGDGTESITPEHYKNTYRIALGGAYQYSPTWRFKAGVAFDQSPTRLSNRTARVPDADRFWLSLGTRLALTETLSIDFGYAHLFFKNVYMNESALGTVGTPASKAIINGKFKTKVDLVGIQLTWNLI